MTEEQVLKQVIESCRVIKPSMGPTQNSSRLVADLGFESIDVVDLFFELQLNLKIEINLQEFSDQLETKHGRRFNDLTLQDITQYLHAHI